MRVLIRRFDALLSQALGIFEFCDDGNCVLRLQIAQSRRTLCFAGHEVRVGEPVLVLHLWNEHIPPFPQAGPDLAWAAQMRRLFIQSLRAVAVQMRRDPRLAGVRAVGGTTTLFSPDSHPGGGHLMQRLGFTIFPYRSPMGRFGEFWENFYAWWLMWTFNVASLRHRQLLHLRRTELWMLADGFLSRYGPGETYHQTAENTVLCQPCAGNGASMKVLDTIQATGDLVVEVGDDRLRVRRGDDSVEVLPTEVRHLVDALGEAAARLVDQQT